MTPVVVTVAVTGSVPRKKDNPAVPITPTEQIESTREASPRPARPSHISMCVTTTKRPLRIRNASPRYAMASEPIVPA